MLRTRILLILLAVAFPATDLLGQNLLDGVRQRLQNRTMRNSCHCGAYSQSDCTCQSYDGPSNGVTPNYQTVSPYQSPTGNMVPGSSMPQSGMQSNISDRQPYAPNVAPGYPGQPVMPNAPYNPGDFALANPAAGIGNASAGGLPPASGNNGAEAGRSAGEGFDLSSQFAGQGEASGVRDLTIGDFFSGSGAIIHGSGAPISSPIGGGDRRRKVSDHFSPIPFNRTFFSYHGFGDAVRDVNGNQADVQRFTFGLERMFLQNNASFEIRVPFVNGVNNQQTQDFSTSAATSTEFGNITLATKYLLVRKRNYAISAGVASIVPTAADAELNLSGGTMDIKNNAVDIIPFLAYYVRPDQNSWVTLTTQLDFNVKGNEYIADQGTNSERSGIFNDQNLYSIDLSTGRWIWSDAGGNNRMVRGLAAIFELHYTTTINDSDVVDLGNSTIANPFNRVDTLNSTVGFRFQIRERTFATIATVLPLRTGEDRPFESELNFNLTRLY